MKKAPAIILVLGCLIPVLSGCVTVDKTATGDGLALGDIHAPVFVGTPPENAFHGLAQLPDGELRHYGYRGPQASPTEHYYILSRDHGLTWDTVGVTVTGGAATGESGPPAARSPWTGAWVRVVSRRGEGTWALRSEQGIDGVYEEFKVSEERFGMTRQPFFMESRRRMLVTTGQSIFLDGVEVLRSCVLYSDDDGRSWGISRIPIGPRHEAGGVHQKTRWQNYAIEPTVAELADGTLWMLLRTSMDNLYESFSRDGGESWSDPVPSRFYSTITMPTLFRLSDRRLLLLWCNTTPLPEVDRSDDMSIRPEQRTGLWEDVFTNRDAIHAAISEDDGKTWIGFRELYLNPLRNEADFATSGGTEVSLDKSVHQSQAAELPGGKILVALGQHPMVRALVIFDPSWLYESSRVDSFDDGLGGWSTHKYVEGIKGHCAFNRDPGPPLVEHPDRPGRKALHIRRPHDPALVCDIDGAVWNFPAGHSGTFTTRIMPQPGGQGGRVCLIDRWFNPTDTLAREFAMYVVEFDGEGRVDGEPLLQPGEWNELSFRWTDSRTGVCALFVNGEQWTGQLELRRPSPNGISYAHFQSAARSEDTRGFLVETVRAGIVR